MAYNNEPQIWQYELGASADKNEIPATEAEEGLATITGLFPSINQVPLESGGIPPERKDFNGLFALLGQSIRYLQRGGVFSYSTSIDYDVGSFVKFNNRVYVCIQENGVTLGLHSPTEGSYWSILVSKSDKIGTPTGAIIPFGGTTAPDGFLLCNGQDVLRDSYPELFNVIGTRYGAGDGSTTFTLPNLKNRVVVGAGGNYELANYGGNNTASIAGSVNPATLSVEQLPAHTHQVVATAENGGTHNHSATGITSENGKHNHSIALNSATNGSHTHSVSGTTENSGAHTHNVSGSVNSNGNHTHSRGSMNITGYYGPVDDMSASRISGAFYNAGIVPYDADSEWSGGDGWLVGLDASRTWVGETSLSGAHSHSISNATADNAGLHAHSLNATAQTSGGHNHAITGNTADSDVHYHSVTASTSTGGAHSHSVVGVTASTGAGQAHTHSLEISNVNIVQPYLALYAIIKY